MVETVAMVGVRPDRQVVQKSMGLGQARTPRIVKVCMCTHLRSGALESSKDSIGSPEHFGKDIRFFLSSLFTK